MKIKVVILIIMILATILIGPATCAGGNSSDAGGDIGSGDKGDKDQINGDPDSDAGKEDSDSNDGDGNDSGSSDDQHTHSFTKHIVDPTCTEGGYYEYKCSCGESYIEGDIAPTGHTWSEIGRDEANCTKPLAIHFECECGALYTKTEGAPLGHSYSSELYPPTCTESGYYMYRCTCGDSYIGGDIAPTGHTWREFSRDEATCTAPDIVYLECECGEGDVTTEGEPLGHSYLSMIYPPSCTDPGYTVFTCRREGCNHGYTANHVDALGHRYTEVVIPPSCNTSGYTRYTCHCGNTYDGAFVDPTGHSYDKTVIPPTCISGGYTHYRCKACGDEDTGDFTNILPHSLEKTVFDPTCTKMGYTVSVCSGCGKTETGEYTSALGHLMSTSYDSTHHWLECSRCGEEEEKRTHYPPVCDCGYEFPVGAILFSRSYRADGYEAYGYISAPDGSLLDLTIPSTYNGERVFVDLIMLLNSRNDIRSLTVEEGVGIFGGTGTTVRDVSSLEEIRILGSCVSSDVSFSFQDCPKLRQIVFPDGMKTLGWLSGCTSLEEITLPASLTSFDFNYNISTGSLSVNFEGTVEDWIRIEGFRKELLNIIDKLYISGEELTHVEIPEGVENIPDYAFFNVKSIKSISFPNSLRYIGRGAFMNCTSLEELSVAAEEIGPEAFMNCKGVRALELKEGILKIGYSAFKCCELITEVIFPDGLVEVGSEMFLGCPCIRYAYVPASVVTVSSVMSDGYHFASSNPIFEPRSNVTILSAAEKGSAAEWMTYSKVYLPYDGYRTECRVETAFPVFFGRSLSDYVVSRGFAFVITSDMTAEVVRYLSEDPDAIIPETLTHGGVTYNVTAIRQFAFLDSGVKTLCISKNIRSMTSMLGATDLELITVDPENTRYTVFDGALLTADMKTLIAYPPRMARESYTVPDSVTSILSLAFACTDLKYIYAHDSSTFNALSFVGRNNLPIVGTNRKNNIMGYNYGTTFVYTDSAKIGNVIFGGDFVYLVKDNKAAILSYLGDATTLHVDAHFTYEGTLYDVISVFHGAFDNNDHLEEISFGEGFVMFGNNEYGDIVYPSGFAFDDSFYYVCMQHDAVFYGCDSLRRITLPKSTETVIFFVSECHALTSVDLGGVKYMTYGIMHCNGIESLTLPSTLENASLYTVWDCPNLSELIIGTVGMTEKNPDAHTVISSYAICECDITRLIIGDEVLTFDANAYQYTEGLKYVYIGAGLVSSDIYFVTAEESELHYYGDLDGFLELGFNYLTHFSRIYVGGELIE